MAAADAGLSPRVRHIARGAPCPVLRAQPEGGVSPGSTAASTGQGDGRMETVLGHGEARPCRLQAAFCMAAISRGALPVLFFGRSPKEAPTLAAPLPAQDRETDGWKRCSAMAADAGSIPRGRHIAQASGRCLSCHCRKPTRIV